MVRLPVVTRQLLPGCHPPQGVEFDAPPVQSHECIRLARMVDMPEVGPGARGVEGRPVPELDDHDAIGGARPPPGLALRNDFPAEFAQLSSRGEVRERKQPPALDATPLDFKVESIQARNYSRITRCCQRRAGGYCAGRDLTGRDTRQRFGVACSPHKEAASERRGEGRMPLWANARAEPG